MGSVSIMWFRRDLRLADHGALGFAARENRSVLPVFVVDPAFAVSGANRLTFLWRLLRSLDADLGGRLVVRHGDPVRVMCALADEVGARDVLISEDFAPYGRRRDAAVASALAAQGVDLLALDSPYCVAPGTVRKQDGSPYSVFTPFARAWNQRCRPRALGLADVDFLAAPRLANHGIPADSPGAAEALPPASERAAVERWEQFQSNGLATYHDRRNTPGDDGTSRLSAYLRWGQLHPSRLLAELGETPGEASFRNELAWREFYADVLFHHPASARQDLRDSLAAIEVDTDDDARDRFARWQQGRTGFPIVDAGMRQLLATGWMHNRVRMITASFLVKDLHVPWQWGARHFMRHLVDGDLASNQHGWQWVAGTGTDAAPYFRIFNPWTQGARVDPQGEYISQWVPELTAVAPADLHRPPAANRNDSLFAEAPVAPMLDHAEERLEAMRRYRSASGRYS